jgi:Protein of unknown function (DUF3572)
MAKTLRMDSETAEWIAIHGLSFLAGDTTRLGRFLSLTGMGPADLAAAREDGRILAGVLEYLLADEPLLLAFAANQGLPPQQVQQAWDILTLDAARRART